MSQEQDAGIARLLKQQAALAGFGSFAFREPVLLNILDEAAKMCADCLGVPFCKVCRYRPEENDLLIEAGYGWKAGVVGRVVSRADETSPQGRAFISGEPVILRDLGVAKDVVLPPFYAEHGIISTVDVIIKGVSGNPYGVLEIDSPILHVYDEHDVTFLTGFANVLAEAVGTAQRIQAKQELLVEMEELIVEKDRLLVERAVLAEELKHRVRNNLQLIHAMLASHLRNEKQPEENNSVRAIIRRVTTLSEVYEQLLGTGMGRSIDLGSYLKALCVSLPELQTDRNSKISLSCDAVSMLVDLDTVTAIGMAVAELVSNSYEHGLFNTKGTIEVSLSQAEPTDDATLTVRDNGSGFVEKTGSKRHGVGLVRRLVEQVHGTAELRSDQGAMWTLRFPVVAPTPEPAALQPA